MGATQALQTQKFKLAGSGIGASDTSIILQSMNLPDGSTNVTTSDLGDLTWATLAPGTAKEEQISFTGVTQNGDGTATLTGVTRGRDFVSPFAETAGYKNSHAGGTVLILSNTAGFYGDQAFKSGDETVDGSWTFTAQPKSTQTPTAVDDIVNKAYADGTSGTPTSYDQNLIAGDAGETVAAGEVVYLKEADGEWYLADASASATSEDVALGIAQGAGTDGNPISGGVLIGGLDKNATYTAGSKYYATDVAGALGVVAGTVEVLLGVGDANNNLVWQHNLTLETLSADEKDLVAGITASAAEINKLDGVTAITAEIEQLAGTTNIGEADTFFGLTDATGTEMETLTDGSNADALHVHDVSIVLDASLTQDVQTNVGTSEIPVYTYTIPANTLGASDGVRLTTYFSSLYPVSGSCDIKLKLGATTVANVAAPTTGNLEYKIDCTVFNKASTSAQVGQLTVTAGAETVNQFVYDYGTAAEDTTGNKDLVLSLDFSDTNADYTFDFGFVEILKQ